MNRSLYVRLAKSCLSVALASVVWMAAFSSTEVRAGGGLQFATTPNNGFSWSSGANGFQFQFGSPQGLQLWGHPQHGTNPFQPQPSYWPPKTKPSIVIPNYPNDRWIERSPAPNVTVVPPKIKPLANKITVTKLAPPKNAGPLDNCVWRLTPTEAKRYEKDLVDLMGGSCGKIRNELGKGSDVIEMRSKLAAIEDAIGRGVAYAELTQMLTRFRTAYAGSLDDAAIKQCDHLHRLMYVHQACVAASRSRNVVSRSALATRFLPTGDIWVLYDPTLPAGTGLYVDSRVMICGSPSRSEMQLSYCSAACGLGLPVGAGNRLPEIAPGESQKDLIEVSLAKNAPSKVNYVLNDRWRYEMEPGEVQKLDRSSQWTVVYARSTAADVARVPLTQTAYRFEVVGDHYELKPAKLTLTIDNRESKNDFQFVADNRIINIKAGESKTLTTNGPLVVAYDRGTGSDASSRVSLNKSGAYKPAIDEETNEWALFAEETDAEESGDST